MPLVDRLERKYSWIAIPGIVRILMGFQALMFLLIYLRPDTGFASQLMLDPGLIMDGQVWRLVSFTILPPTGRIIGMLFVVFFTIFLGDVLERMWGSFRLTLYVIGGIASILVASFLAYYVLSPGHFYLFYLRTTSTGYIWVTMILLAVAVMNPNMIVNILGILPVKIMWIAIFDAALVFLDLVQLVRVHVLLGGALLLAMSNFLIVFGPSAIRQMRQRGEVAVRRRKFESAQLPESEALHRCATCDKTEADDDELEFRVAADGEEYCIEHLPGKPAG